MMPSNRPSIARPKSARPQSARQANKTNETLGLSANQIKKISDCTRCIGSQDVQQKDHALDQLLGFVGSSSTSILATIGSPSLNVLSLLLNCMKSTDSMCLKAVEILELLLTRASQRNSKHFVLIPGSVGCLVNAIGTTTESISMDNVGIQIRLKICSIFRVLFAQCPKSAKDLFLSSHGLDSLRSLMQILCKNDNEHPLCDQLLISTCGVLFDITSGSGLSQDILRDNGTLTVLCKSLVERLSDYDFASMANDSSLRSSIGEAMSLAMSALVFRNTASQAACVERVGFVTSISKALCEAYRWCSPGYPSFLLLCVALEYQSKQVFQNSDIFKADQTSNMLDLLQQWESTVSSLLQSCELIRKKL